MTHLEHDANDEVIIGRSTDIDCQNYWSSGANSGVVGAAVFLMAFVGAILQSRHLVNHLIATANLDLAGSPIDDRFAAAEEIQNQPNNICPSR